MASSLAHLLNAEDYDDGDDDVGPKEADGLGWFVAERTARVGYWPGTYCHHRKWLSTPSSSSSLYSLVDC